MPKKTPFKFSSALLSWFDKHGRKQLPWQEPIEPYRVWLSEIMLQQTQVETVIPYFDRFTSTFATVQDLAKADIEEVLHLWTGLGYYARARNLHKCAIRVVEEYGGEFPPDPEQLISLPGIGKSTAHAIASIAFGQPTAILDGNVKRVLARFHTVPDWPGSPKVEKVLWQHAESHMPIQRCGDYTQAIMDLGATVCKRSKPLCDVCPMSQHCNALNTNSIAQYPGKKPKKSTPTKNTTMLIAQNSDGQLLMQQRPSSGIWGGLWSFFEFENEASALKYCQQTGRITHHEHWAPIQHVFSHYKLTIDPFITVLEPKPQIRENNTGRWLSIEEALNLGLPAPVKRIIETLQTHETLLI